MSEFRRRILEGVAWNAVAQIGNQAINFGVTVLLTRLLPASAFGLVAMAGVITGFFLAFPGFGLGASLVQKADAQERHFTSIYWVNLAVCIGLAAVVALAGPVAAWFFGEPALAKILPTLSLQFPISALGAIQRVHLRRELRFDLLSRSELIASLCGGVCGIALALAGAGVWSLVARSLASGLLSSLFVDIARPYRPRLRIDSSAVRECAGFGMNIVGNEILVYFFRNFDNLLIGKYVGSVALGLYSRAYTFMLVPLLGLTQVVSAVLFPAISKIQDDDPRVRAVFLRVAGVVALAGVPSAVWFVIAAEPFVHVVLGPRWDGVVVLLQILSPTGIWECVGGLSVAIFRGKGRTDLHLRVTMASYMLSPVAYAVGLRWGVEGVAYSYVVSSAIVTFPALHFARRLIGLPASELLGHFVGVLASALAAGVVGYGAMLAMADHVGEAGRLVGTTAAFFVAYAGIVLSMRPAPFRDLVALLRARRAMP